MTSSHTEMEFFIPLLLLWMTVDASYNGVMFNAVVPEGTLSVCQFDVFNASCAHNEVIIVETARYGRMRQGTCVNTDYGHIGCSQDVLPYLHSLCSGRRECELEIPDKTLKVIKPCPTELSNFLEIKYRCQKVHTSSEESCDHGHSRPLNITVPAQTAQEPGTTIIPEVGYLSSLITSATGHGSIHCPWIIRVPSGQRLNITLMDYSLPVRIHANELAPTYGSQAYCHKYAVIQERVGTTKRAVVCGGDGVQRSVYMSAGNVVEIHLMRYTTPKKFAHFLLQYEAVGCARLEAPTDGWIEQVGQEVVIGCNQTHDSWSLRCNGNSWVGEMRNCSAFGSGYDNVVWDPQSENWQSPLGILIVTSLGVALGLIIGVILLASVLFCLKRQPPWCRADNSNYTTSMVVAASDSEDGGRREYVTYCKRHPATTGNIPADSVELVHLNGDQTYGTMWKARPPPPSYTSGCTATSPCNLSRIIPSDNLESNGGGGQFIGSIPTGTAVLAQTVPSPNVSTALPTEMHVIRVGGATGCTAPNSMSGSNDALQGVDVVKHATAALTSFRPPRDNVQCSGASELHEYERPTFVAVSDGAGTLHCRPINSVPMASCATNIHPIS